MEPVLEGLRRDYAGRMDVEFIDVNKNPRLARSYGIRVIPTQIFISADGKELYRHEGYSSREDILASWGDFGVTFQP
jgi:thioredoxin 1